MMKKLILTLLCLISFFPACGSTEGDDKNIISIELTVPDAAWEIEINEIYEVENELWVIAELNRKTGFAAQVISKIKDSVEIHHKKLTVKYYVIGKIWQWENKEEIHFIKSKSDIEDYIKNREQIYKAKNL